MKLAFSASSLYEPAQSSIRPNPFYESGVRLTPDVDETQITLLVLGDALLEYFEPRWHGLRYRPSVFDQCGATLAGT